MTISNARPGVSSGAGTTADETNDSVPPQPAGQAVSRTHRVDCGLARCDKPDPHGCAVHGELHRMYCVRGGAS